MTNAYSPFRALAGAKAPKPNFFIVGAPKCGTTSLHEYLQHHPDVFMPYYKEPHFFGSDLDGSRFRQFRNKPEKYLKLFHDVRGEKRIGESSPWYLASERAAQEIHDYDPQAKIIIMLRNPVDMMYSMWSQFRYSGNEQIEDFEEALAAESDRRAGKRIRRAAHCITGLHYRRMTRFAEQVQRFYDVFGEDQVMVIIFDDFRADTPAVYQAVLEFLGLDICVNVDFGVRNPNKEVRLAWLQKLIISTGFSLMLLKDRLTYLATTSRLMPYSYRTRAVEGVISAYTRYERRSPLLPATRQRLASEAADDIDALGKLLDRDLSFWYRPGDVRSQPAIASAPPSAARKSKRRRQMVVRAISILVTVALLAVLVGEVKWDEFDQLLGRVPAVSWAGALLAYFALNLFRALRFRVLLDKRHTPWRLLAPITLYHNFLVRALPFKLGELSYIALLRSRLNYSMAEGVSSLFGARILELLIIIMVFAAGVLTTAEALAAQQDRLLSVIIITFLLSVCALYFGGAIIRAFRAMLPPVQRAAGKKRDIITAIETRSLHLAAEFDRIRQPRLFLTALLISCFTYSSSFLTNYILLRALGVTLDLSEMIAIISIGMFASAFPFNVSGFGVVEVAWRFGLVQFAGWAESDATATGFLLHGFQLFAAAAYGLIGYLLIHLSPRLPEPQIVDSLIE